jgi:hypothetical protein
MDQSQTGSQHIVTFAADEHSGRLVGLAVDSLTMGPPWNVFKWSLDLNERSSMFVVSPIEAHTNQEHRMLPLILDAEFKAPISSVFRDDSLITIFVNKKLFTQISRTSFRDMASENVPSIRSLRRDRSGIGGDSRLPSLPHSFFSTTLQDILLFPHGAYAVGDAKTEFEKNEAKAHRLCKCSKMPKLEGDIVDYVGDHSRVVVEARGRSDTGAVYGLTLLQKRFRKDDDSKYIAYLNIMTFNSQGRPENLCRTIIVHNWSPRRGLWSFAPAPLSAPQTTN